MDGEKLGIVPHEQGPHILLLEQRRRMATLLHQMLNLMSLTIWNYAMLYLFTVYLIFCKPNWLFGTIYKVNIFTWQNITLIRKDIVMCKCR